MRREVWASASRRPGSSDDFERKCAANTTTSSPLAARTCASSSSRLKLVRVFQVGSVGPIRVTMEGSTAVLTGVVASEQDRQLAEGVALLEPEVETVRNELTVEAGAGGLNSPSNIP